MRGSSFSRLAQDEVRGSEDAGRVLNCERSCDLSWLNGDSFMMKPPELDC